MTVNGHKFTENDLINSLFLYAVTDRYWLKEGETLESVTSEALDGGVTFVQLREKNLSPDSREMLEHALSMKELCKKRDVPFVIDDDVELAKRIDCDGVHVGQSDMACKKARQILGPEKIIGVSAQTVEEALLAEKQGADYLGVGAVFHTGSKDDAVEVSHETLADICGAVQIPVIAIGGIKTSNLYELEGSGIKGIAVISAIYGESDKRAAAGALSDKLREILK